MNVVAVVANELTVTVTGVEIMDGSESVTLNSNDQTPTAVDALVVKV
jgi:hypothetical protein